MTNLEKKPRWQRLGYWDFVCAFYYICFFLSFSITFDWPIDFRENIGANTAVRKLALLLVFWGGSVVIAQTAMGWAWIPKMAWRMIRFPFSSIRVMFGFFRDSRKTFSICAKRIPVKLIFFILMFVTLISGATEVGTSFLILLKPLVWAELAFLVGICFWWTLNPIPTLSKFKELLSDTLRTKAVQSLATVEVTEAKDAYPEILKRLESFKLIAQIVPKILAWLSGPKVFFSAFAFIFVFGLGGSLLLLTTILRIEHLTTVGGAFSGNFFSGSWSDFFYIALNHMIGADVYGITVVSPNVRYTLSLLPLCMLAFGLLLVTAYTMVGQKIVEKSVDEIGLGLISVASEAAKQVSESKTVHLVDKRKEKQAVQPVSLTANLSTADGSSIQNLSTGPLP